VIDEIEQHFSTFPNLDANRLKLTFLVAQELAQALPPPPAPDAAPVGAPGDAPIAALDAAPVGVPIATPDATAPVDAPDAAHDPGPDAAPVAGPVPDFDEPKSTNNCSNCDHPANQSQSHYLFGRTPHLFQTHWLSSPLKTSRPSRT
jgi:hypothetical protein